MRIFKTQAQIDEEARLAIESTKTKYEILKRLLIYARQSTKNQLVNNKESTLMQTVKLRKLGIEKGFSEDLTTLFVENKFDRFGNVSEAIRSASGSLSIDERAGLRIICESIETGTVAAVLVFAVDRLFRDEEMVLPAAFVKLCKDFRVLVITPNYDFDFNNPNKKDRDAFLDDARAAAAYIKDHVRGRMLVGKREKAMRGEYVGQSVAVGLMLDDAREHFIANPHWSPNVAKLFTRFHELGNFSDWYREIYSTLLFPDLPDDIKARIGKIHLTQVTGGYTIKGRDGCLKFLTNPVYIGHTLFNGYLIRDTHPAIVSEEDFFFAFNMLSNTDLNGNSIEHPEKVVRYQQYTGKEPSIALLSGTRPTGKTVLTSPDRNVYVMNCTARGIEERYTARNFKGFHSDEFAIRVSDIDALVTERLMRHLDPTFEPMETLEQSFAETKNTLDEMAIFETLPLGSPVETMQDTFQTVDTQEPTKLTTTDNIRAELQRGIARLQREYDVTFDIMTDKELRDNREAKARLLKRLDTLNKKQAHVAQEEVDRQEAMSMLASGTVKERWGKWNIEKRRRFIRLVTQDIVLEQVADTWLKLTIVFYSWVSVNTPHVGVLYVDTAYILRRRSGQIAWTQEENKILTDLYPRASRRDILHCLPRRSWKSVRSQAVDLSVLRETRIHEVGIPDDVSQEDIAFMQEHDLLIDLRDTRIWWKSEVCNLDARC